MALANNKGLVKLERKTNFLTGFRNLYTAAKSSWSGDGILNNSIDPATYRGGVFTQNFWQFLTGSHSFNRKGLEYLIETGYSLNPSGFGIINKIFLSSKNIKVVPYRSGKVYKSATFDMDLSFGILNLCQCGDTIIWNKEVVGFGRKPVILNGLRIDEVSNGRGYFKYYYWKDPVTRIEIPSEDLLIIPFIDMVNDGKTTKRGISPLQAALMPIESLREMYTADTALLKNKGADIMITNGSDNVVLPYEQEDMDKDRNDRIAGAQRMGKAVTSTSKLEVHQLGRSTRELALWDGYKIKTRDLCTALQVDSSLFNDPDNKKFSNVQEADKFLYTSCIIPFCELILKNPTLIKWLGYEPWIDTNGIECLQLSQSIRFEKNQTITNVILQLNEAVKKGTISQGIAVGILNKEWGYDLVEAQAMIATPSNEPDPTQEEPAE